jgi:hypothetical protein
MESGQLRVRELRVGGVEMHLFSLWCVPSGVRRVNKGYIQLPLVDIDLDSIFSSIPLKKMR